MAAGRSLGRGRGRRLCSVIGRGSETWEVKQRCERRRDLSWSEPRMRMELGYRRHRGFIGFGNVGQSALGREAAGSVGRNGVANVANVVNGVGTSVGRRGGRGMSGC